MPRPLIDDTLLVHRFHVLDVNPSISVPPFVLWPSAAFSSISAPGMNINVEDIQEGTSDFIHHVLGKATSDTVTFTKGVSTFNSDFWRWTIACLAGNPAAGFSVSSAIEALAGWKGRIPAKRRNLMIMHFAPFDLMGLLEEMKNPEASVSGVVGAAKSAALLAVAGAAQGLDKVISMATKGFADIGIEYVPAKIYMLIDCLPIRYKPASDFDAATSAVSFEELEVTCERFEEFALTA